MCGPRSLVLLNPLSPPGPLPVKRLRHTEGLTEPVAQNAKLCAQQRRRGSQNLVASQIRVSHFVIGNVKELDPVPDGFTQHLTDGTGGDHVLGLVPHLHRFAERPGCV